MSPELRDLWRATAYLIFITACLAIVLFFSLVFIYQISPNFWNFDNPNLPTHTPPASHERPLVFLTLFATFFLPSTLGIINLRLVWLCVAPSGWVFWGELFNAVWVLTLVAMLTSSSVLFVGLNFPQNAEGFRALLQQNVFFYPVYQLLLGVLILAIGGAGWRGGRFPRLLAGGTMGVGGVICLLSPWLTHSGSFVAKTQPQELLYASMLVIFGAYLYLGSPKASSSTPTPPTR